MDLARTTFKNMGYQLSPRPYPDSLRLIVKMICDFEMTGVEGKAKYLLSEANYLKCNVEKIGWFLLRALRQFRSFFRSVFHRTSQFGRLCTVP